MAKFISGKKPNKFKEKILFIASKLKWLDPFTYVDLFVMPYVKKISDEKLVEDLVNVFFALFFAFVIYFLLGVLFGTVSPLVIVYSSSMEDTFFRGDVMGLKAVSPTNGFGKEIFIDKEISELPVENYLKIHYDGGIAKMLEIKDANEFVLLDDKGSVVVYNAEPRNIPIIHRAVTKIIAEDGNFILTKGDNKKTNPTIDQDCGKIRNDMPQKSCITYYAIPTNEIQGVAFFKIPYVGCVKLWLVDDLLSIITTGTLPKNFNGFC